MKKIQITVFIEGREEYPGCADILATFPEFCLIVPAGDLQDPDAWSAISRSDVVLLDEATLAWHGEQSVRSITERNPRVRVLLILDEGNEERVLEALSMGIAGVMERSALVATLRKAIPVLHSGEAWVPRRLVSSLRNRLNGLANSDDPSSGADPGRGPARLN